ncbi:hypothetical protein D9613_005300 [Agrocybe pediades]|uniref:J domain-containing protein n=1 Tax=Agrocybe pediades TaxID=84607 RepID=A0A8H4QZ78_9AGAR|nr:hypothetical protein D9613_005300 [Agrocybe pediades]
MRLFSFVFAFLALLATTALAWEKEDHEIFDLVSAIEASEGKGTTFYSWLDVPPTASTNEIAKAYRKKSMQLHPDKNPNDKAIHERFARLGVVSTILRNKESRERYDFFYKNGVPKWRGTGYYYSRFRPGLGSVMVFLAIVTSGLQYLIQNINYKKDLERIEHITGKAKATAWGPKMVPVKGQRKVRVGLGESRDEDGDVVGSKFIDMVVEDNGDVYLLEPNGDMHLLNTSTAIKPTIGNTWFLNLTKSLIAKVSGGKVGGNNAVEQAYDEKHAAPDVDSDDGSSTTGSEAPAGSGRSTPRNGDDTKPVKLGPTTKAGGMRRKNNKRR